MIFDADIVWPSLLVPNVFSPNNDDLNAFFRPIERFGNNRPVCELSGANLEIQVYNRWGNLIADPTCHWDGKSIDGEAMEEGIYYYIMTLNSCSSEGDKLDGYIHLLR